MLFVGGFVAIVAAIAIPQSFATLDAFRTKGATRFLTSRMALARMQAVKRSAYVALRFEGTGPDVSFAVFVDGNGNGVRTRDIAARIDRQIDAPVRLSEMFPGVTIGVSTTAGSGNGDGDGDGVRIGSSRFLSFSPLGSATSGTVYVRGRDGTQFAVRISGATARTRVLRYEPRTRQWVTA